MEYGFEDVRAASAFVKPFGRKLYRLKLALHELERRGDQPLPPTMRQPISTELTALIRSTVALQDTLAEAAPSRDPTEKVLHLQQAVADLLSAAEALEARAPTLDATWVPNEGRKPGMRPSFGPAGGHMRRRSRFPE